MHRLTSAPGTSGTLGDSPLPEPLLPDVECFPWSVPPVTSLDRFAALFELVDVPFAPAPPRLVAFPVVLGLGEELNIGAEASAPHGGGGGGGGCDKALAPSNEGSNHGGLPPATASSPSAEDEEELLTVSTIIRIASKPMAPCTALE